jgi:hypothetical protein
VKYYCSIVFVSLLASRLPGQQQSATYNYDVNGHPVETVGGVQMKSASGSEKRDTVRTVNGRTVPVQSVDEKVISNSGGVRVLERIVKKYDANGIPGPPEKVQIEERKNPDGSGSVATTVLRGDINGNYQVTERSKAEIRKSGDTTTTNTIIERPTVNGALEQVEKTELTKRESNGGANATENSTVYRRDANGRFFEAARASIEQTAHNGSSEENAAVYEAGPGGQMQLVRQTVSRTVKTGNNGEQKEINVFEPALAGRVNEAGSSKPVLREQRVIAKSATANGAVEAVSVRRTSPSDPGRLGPAQKVEETVCTGKCN